MIYENQSYTTNDLDVTVTSDGTSHSSTDDTLNGLDLTIISDGTSSSADNEYIEETKCVCRLSLTKKEYIRMKIAELADSFTIHGLSRCVKGRSVESAFWSAIIIAGFVCSSIIIHGLVMKFLSYKVYSEIRFQITDRNYFPSITFCEEMLLIDSYFAYCGISPRFSAKKFVNLSETCNYDVVNNTTRIRESLKYRYWATDMFNVSSCWSWEGNVCNTRKYLKSVADLNNSCITWNYDGNFYDSYSQVDLTLHFKKPSHLKYRPNIIAIFHDPAIKELDLSGKLHLSPNQNFDIKLDKMVIKRLPGYPSNCSNDKTSDIFPGKYSRYSCIESFNIIKMYENCGTTMDYARQFIPQHIKKKYARNHTIGEVMNCMGRHIRAEIKQSSCPFPCDDLELRVDSVLREPIKSRSDSSYEYKLHIHHARVDTYKVMEEKPLYTWDQMACEIGGFIGLVMGMSVLSIVEVFAYTGLKLVEWIL